MYDDAGVDGWTRGAGFETFLALRPARPPRNPLVPERAPLPASGADLRASLKSFRQLRARAPPSPWQRALSSVRGAAREAIGRHFAGEEAVMAALLLGERGTIDRALTDSLARTGLVHLIAISGLHVGIAVGALLLGLRLTGLPRPPAALAATAMLPLVHALVVARPPVARACIMAAALLLGVALGRRTAPGNGLALATLLLTAADPWVTHDYGFQLSTAATAAIVALVGRGERPDDRRRRVPLVVTGARRWLSAALLVTLAAQLAVAPLLAATSFRLPTAPLVVNLVAVPLLTIALVTGVATLAADAVGLEWLAAGLALPGGGAVDGLRQLTARADASVTAWTVPASATTATTLAASLCLALLATRRWRCIPNTARALLGVGALACAAGALTAGRVPVPPAPGTVRLVAFDVGQGDALLVETADVAWLVDTGGSPFSDYDPGTAVLAPALRARGLDALDAVIISHLHADHAGGLAGVLAEIDVAAVWTAPFDPAGPAGRALPEVAAKVPVRIGSRGRSLGLGDCAAHFLYPPAGAVEGDVSNDHSLVLTVGCGRRTVVLTGDTERGAEAAWAPTATRAGGVRVLKSPHHGSRTSSSEALLDAVTPRHAVVSAGWRNRFGLPDAEVLGRYRARGIAVYRTDRDGAITLTAGRRVRVRGERWSAGRGRRVVGGWLR